VGFGLGGLEVELVETSPLPFLSAVLLKIYLVLIEVLLYEVPLRRCRVVNYHFLSRLGATLPCFKGEAAVISELGEIGVEVRLLVLAYLRRLTHDVLGFFVLVTEVQIQV
jgi:hypothetical protein